MEDELYARFYITPEKLLNVDWMAPTTPTKTGLGRPRGMEPPALKIDLLRMPGDKISGFAKDIDQGS